MAAHRERLTRAAAEKVPWTGLSTVDTLFAQCEKLLNIVGLEKAADEKHPSELSTKVAVVVVERQNLQVRALVEPY